MDKRIRLVLLGVTTIALVGLGWPPASALAAGKTLAVHVEGADAETHRTRILELLPEGVDVADEGEFKAAMRGVGLPGQLGFALVNKAARKQVVKKLGKACEKGGVDAVVVARVNRGRKGAELIVVMVEPGATEATVDGAASLGGKAGEQKRALAELLEEPLKALAPPPPARPETTEPGDDGEGEGEGDDDSKDDEEEPAPGEFKAHQPGWELFSAHLGVELGGRYFKYSESPANSLNTRPYEVFGVPALVLGGEVFPAATTGIPFASDIGLYLQYAHFFGLSSQTADSRVFGTSWNRFNLGLKIRHTFGKPDGYPVTPSFRFGYGFENFTFEPKDERATEIAAEVADAKYQELKIGVDSRFNLGPVGITPRLLYVAPVKGSGVYERFRGSSLKAVELGLDLGVMLGLGVEILAGVAYTRFGSSFSPEPGDAYVAGGALDERIGLKLAAEYVY